MNMKKLIKTLSLSSLAFIALSGQAAVRDGQKFGDWEGACDEQGRNCAIVQIQTDNTNRPVAAIFIQKMPEANNNPVMVITVPLGVNLHAQLGLAVNQTELTRLDYDFCDPNGCNAALPLEGELLNRIKAGNTLQVAAFVGNQQQTVEFSLKGITAGINAL